MKEQWHPFYNKRVLIVIGDIALMYLGDIIKKKGFSFRRGFY